MRSTIKLYKSEISPEKNMWIENIHEYLTKKSIKTYEAENFMYVKIGLNITITVDAGQEYVGNQNLGNYCEIFEDNRSFYYFITNAEWTSKSAVRLTLSMDTINTYGEDLEFTDKTVISREHENRFSNEFKDNSDGSRTYFRNIDHEPENIVLPKILINSKRITDLTGDFNWYLIYKTRDDLTPENTANPIECDLIADKPLLIKKGHENLPALKLLPNDFEVGKYYYFALANNPKGELQVDQDTFPIHELIDTVIWKFYRGERDNYVYSTQLSYHKDSENSYSLIEETPFAIYNFVKIISGSVLKTSNSNIRNYTDIINLNTEKNVAAGPQFDLKTITINEVDKTNSKLMKIIKLPYCPVEIGVTADGEYQFPNDFKLVNGMMRLSTGNLSREFRNKVALDDIYQIMTVKINPKPLDKKSVALESKLWNSEFYTYKYVYDSFYRELKLENLTPNQEALNNEFLKVPIEFKPTNTINSKFAFKFEKDSYYYDYTTESDYENYILVSRNNEETIFSNDYINYIRNGYNYDKKAKDMSLAQGLIGSALGLGQAGTALYAGQRGLRNTATKEFNKMGLIPHLDQVAAAGGNANAAMAKMRNRYVSENVASPFLSAAAINAGFGAVNGLIGTIYGQVQAQDTINAKLQQLASQATAVSGSDDVDLLGYYNGNRLERKIYLIRDLEKKNIYNLFYYTGYSHPVQDIPNLESRYWFNYVQCTPEFKNELTSVYTDYLDDIKVRFEAGVTKYHYHENMGREWDIEQDYENWENSVINK